MRENWASTDLSHIGQTMQIYKQMIKFKHSNRCPDANKTLQPRVDFMTL